MPDADGEASLSAATWTGRLPRRRSLLAFVAFLLLFGQPAVVFALALTTASPTSLAVVVAGTVLLAAPAARAYLGGGWSVGRLADFVLAVAFTQIGLVLVRTTLAGAASGLRASVVEPALVVVSYPLVYLVLTRVVWADGRG